MSILKLAVQLLPSGLAPSQREELALFAVLMLLTAAALAIVIPAAV
jgi:hypothetical protein